MPDNRVFSIDLHTKNCILDAARLPARLQSMKMILQISFSNTISCDTAAPTEVGYPWLALSSKHSHDPLTKLSRPLVSCVHKHHPV